MAKVIITGAAGSIGSELCRQLAKDNEVIALDNNETGVFDLAQEIKVIAVIADIKNQEKIDRIFRDNKPDIVFHAAAYKHLPLMEEYPEEAVETNVWGTRNLIKISQKYKVRKFVFISSDKAVNPNSVMGLTKKMGELLCQKAGYIAVRFGNVLGSRGSVIPIWKKQIEKGEPITITHPEMKRYFMSIEDACSLVIQASQLGKGGEIFILDMGEQIKIIDIAKRIAGEDYPIKIIGVRKGEKMFEELLTEEEKQKVVKQGKFFVIRN